MKKINQQDKIYLLLGLFIGSLLASNFLGSKITAFNPPSVVAGFLNIIFWPIIFGINTIATVLNQFTIFANPFLPYNFFDTISVSVGILTVPVMFLITDVVAEVLGRQTAKKFINVALIVMIFTVIITTIAVGIPVDQSRKFFSQSEYENIFGASIRIMIASIIAFIIAQYHDIWAFEFWKRKTKGRFLWLRNNLSTIGSQFLDSTIFMFIAFYGLTPRYDTLFIFSLIIPYWIFKILFALLDTPFAYLGVKWLKDEK